MGVHQLEVLDDPDAVHRRGAELIARHARDAVAERGTCALAVSGGSDPWPMFSQLEDLEMDWTKTEVFQVDERVAPPGSDERNLTHLIESLSIGAQAMAAGSFHAPVFTVAWPTGEFGPMGLEGAVRLGYRKELEAVVDPQERQALYERMVNEAYQQGKGLNIATYLELDDVIDPMESRRWIARGLDSLPATAPRSGKKRPCIDTW